MTVFIAAGDEADDPAQAGTFLYGAFVAPLWDWQDWFSPAWEERVLNQHPPIPYLHMTEIRSSRWRMKHGITQSQSERRVDEAVT